MSGRRRKALCRLVRGVCDPMFTRNDQPIVSIQEMRRVKRAYIRRKPQGFQFYLRGILWGFPVSCA